MKNITPFLWFDNNAEQAVDFYTSIFKDSKILAVTRYGDSMPGPAGSVMTIHFKINDQEFMALNGGRQFKFNESVSFLVPCKNQDEIDEFWEKLSEGGEKSQCGWLKDKFGLSWQIVPSILDELLSGKDQEKTNRVMAAVMKMTKLNIHDLKKAYEQPSNEEVLAEKG